MSYCCLFPLGYSHQHTKIFRLLSHDKQKKTKPPPQILYCPWDSTYSLFAPKPLKSYFKNSLEITNFSLPVVSNPLHSSKSVLTKLINDFFIKVSNDFHWCQIHVAKPKDHFSFSFWLDLVIIFGKVIT